MNLSRTAGCNAASERPVILLVAEAVTLAHYGRIVSLAKSLDASTYEVVVASDPRYAALVKPFGCAFHPIHSIPSSRFERALAKGAPLYDAGTLTRYVEEDLRVLDAVEPDLVIGDFRLSLAVSAPVRRVPYAAVVNAYWSPYAEQAYPVPDLPFVRCMGLRLGQKLFDLARPLAFALHARPLNQVRRRYGLPPLGHDLRQAYTWSDCTLYADIPEVVPTRRLPPNHRYIGPVFWSSETPLPDWWGALPEEKPVVFLTLGSSGRADALPALLEALARLPATVVVATAGKVDPGAMPANVHVCDYLPVDAAVRRARLVICNGGSLTTYRAMAEGVPVIGLCSNMDQLLNMAAVERLGAGIALRAARANGAEVLDAANAVLQRSSYAEAARAVGRTLSQYDAGQRFREVVDEMLTRKTMRSVASHA